MSSSLIIGLEMTLVLGGVLGLGVWELVRLRRDRSKPPAARAAVDEETGKGPANPAP